jgi:hypothetical protein
MNEWNPTQLLFFVVLIAPGFVATSVYRLLVPSPRRDPTSFTVELASYGMVNLALVSWMIPAVLDARLMKEQPGMFAAGMLTMLAVVPAFLALLTFAARRARWATRWFQHPMPTAWDFLFSQRRALWVLFHLKDGQRIGGFFGRESYASSYPIAAEIYVENVWRVDENGRFAENVEGNAGMIIRYADCHLMEFYRAEGGS